MEPKNIIPFGEHCLIATTLKQVNKRTSSLPFDWLVSNCETNVKITQNVIDDTFNLEEYCEFDVITLRNKNDFTFNHHIHHFLKQNNLSIALLRRDKRIYKSAVVYLFETFQRRFNRLKKYIVGDCIIICSCKDNTTDTTFLEKLLEINPKNNILFFHKHLNIQTSNIQTFNFNMYDSQNISKQIKLYIQ